MNHFGQLAALVALASLTLPLACEKNNGSKAPQSPPTTQPTAPEEQQMSPASRQIPGSENEPMSPPSDEPETVPEPAPHPDVPFTGDAGVMPDEPMNEPMQGAGDGGLRDRY